jgi:hypothetical protein
MFKNILALEAVVLKTTGSEQGQMVGSYEHGNILLG